MKKLISTIFVFNFFIASLLGQKLDTAGWANLDYTVPQSPAFKILGSSPSNIIQPTSLKSIALNVGDYLITNGSVIPKNFAVEINPMLLNNTLSLNSYQKCPILYRWSLSFGTTANSKGSYDIAEGLRITLWDKTDLRTDKAFIDTMAKFADDAVNAFVKAKKIYANAYKTTFIDVGDKYDKPDVNVKKSVDSIVNLLLHKDADQYIINTRNTFKQNNWNKSIVQLGVAGLQSSLDSLAKNITATTKYAGWLSGGFPICTNGQLLIGVKAERQDSNMVWINNGSGAIRFYYGENNIKGYAQSQITWINTIPSITTSLGCDYNLSNGIWIDVAVNLVTDQYGNTIIKPSFNFNFGTPEKKKT
ncbi:MAG TPA: hypothetical protein VK705_02240 [Ferruginibacter sp.]|jgi:hypothetical protein|nr:hypothetical protein [Ferruginibacter sp.]